MMIKDFFRKARKPLSEMILQATRELGKCYSRLELASSKLGKRDKELFDACSFYLKKGSKARATVYANEIAEIRKVLSILQHTQLSVERAILRLDTLKVASPTFESLKAVFGDVRNALGLVANVMPSITPEIDNLNSAIGEILQDTQFNLSVPAPLVVNDPTTEAILKEAANFVEQELESRIPEPPPEAKIPEPVKPRRPLIALAADGSEVLLSKDGSTIANNGSSDAFDACSNPVLEELVIDYIERNNGEMNVTRCAEELNVPPAKVFEALESLSRKGKIRIEQ
jgi:division protein CdvB (Snf7/Vps24/ESCRT-III family)